MLDDVHAALRDILYARGQMNPAEIDIRFETPTREFLERLTRPTLSLFLVRVQENVDLRRNGYETRRVNGHSERRLAPRRMDLGYLVTALTGDIADEHRLLWRALATLMREPTLPEELLPASLRGLDPPLTARVAQPEQSPGPFEIWGQLDSHPRASFAYTLTAPLDLDVAISAPLVLTRTVRYRRSLEADAPLETRHHIGGVVRDKDGAPVAGATVGLVGSASEAISDARGEFVLPDVPEGTLKLRVTVKSKTRTVELTAPGEGYVVEV